MSEEYDVDTRPFTLSCPECGGPLFPPEATPVVRYRCHIGHVLTWPAVAEAQLARIEYSLGAALAVVKERAELCRQLAQHGEIDGPTADVVIAETTERAERLKALLAATWRTVSSGATGQRASE